MTMTTTEKTTEDAKPGVEYTLKLHAELIEGTLEVILGVCEAGQDLEVHAKEIAVLALDTADRLEMVTQAAKLMNEALRELIDFNKGMLKRIDAAENRIEEQEIRINDLEDRMTILEIEF